MDPPIKSAGGGGGAEGRAGWAVRLVGASEAGMTRAARLTVSKTSPTPGFARAS